MNRGNEDTTFFEKWGEHRHRYYTKKAAIAIICYSSSLLFIFSYLDLDIVIYPYLLIYFILIASFGIIIIAIYFLISNPPITLEHQSKSLDEKEE